MQALRTSDDASNPVYVSVGHKFSLETATQLVIACSRKRIPEPVRQVCLWLPSLVCARRFEVRSMLCYNTNMVFSMQYVPPSLVPRLSVGGERESLVSTVCACT